MTCYRQQSSRLAAAQSSAYRHLKWRREKLAIWRHGLNKAAAAYQLGWRKYHGAMTVCVILQWLWRNGGERGAA